MNEKIIILDFGSQYTQLIGRRIRECKVYSEIHPYNISLKKIKSLNPKGIILSGSPHSVYDKDAPICNIKIFDLKIPILGICYGMHLITYLLKGKVEKSNLREYGNQKISIKIENGLFNKLKKTFNVWMSHGDKVLKLPSGFIITAYTKTCTAAAIMNKTNRIFGVQFHPEVVHTNFSIEIFENFLKICNCNKNWTMKSFIKNKIEEIKLQVRDEKVICALSGGVDSTVTATLIYRAIGNNIKSFFVDNGLLRKNEGKTLKILKTKFNLNVEKINAQESFLKKLSGIIDPEQKRKIIGNEFIRIFEKEAKKNKSIKFLAQGTLYPDVIESKSVKGPSSIIKTHHNVGGLPSKMKFKLVEPLKELFKDEVRILGKELGLPDEILYRQPFPGPGLAIRIIGEVTQERLNILQEADVIVLEEIKKADLYKKLWQSFAVLLPIKTVGVMGDARTYENVIALRIVNSTDGMTADWAKLPYEILEIISNRIINEVHGINRVVYDISSKPPSTIEWE